jgi:hypothetical protein
MLEPRKHNKKTIAYRRLLMEITDVLGGIGQASINMYPMEIQSVAGANPCGQTESYIAPQHLLRHGVVSGREDDRGAVI